MTAGRWPWKSASAKECVTTHLPNCLALKMDGAEACDDTRPSREALSGGVGGRGGQASKRVRERAWSGP